MTAFVQCHPRPRTRAVGKVLLAVFGVFGLFGTADSRAGEDDRVFRDGFEPCCSLGGKIDGCARADHASAGCRID